ncbi:MAG: ABC transporter ATP-binding protein [Clostridia bacterium]|nr:ABC transporter ATP-binding protein [Clostridia bacterium]
MILRAENISKRYFRKSGQANYFEAVKPLSLTLGSGTVTVLMGRSGGGKTTLLHMLSGLLTPTEGKVWLGDTDLYALPDGRLSRLRNEMIGVVPQGRSAVETLTVLENVLLPGQLYGRPVDNKTAMGWLEALEIGHLADERPAALSGGELRRMAIARALAHDPAILLADEPTGDLDDASTRTVLSILQKAAHEQGKTVFVVTHENEALDYADQAYRMDGGSLI